jgi:hypothetical protein
VAGTLVSVNESDLPKIDKAILKFSRRHEPFFKWFFRNGFGLFYAWVLLASLLSSVLSLAIGGIVAWFIPMMMVSLAMLHAREPELSVSGLIRVVLNPVLAILLTFPLDILQPWGVALLVAVRVALFLFAAWQPNCVGAFVFGERYVRLKNWSAKPLD